MKHWHRCSRWTDRKIACPFAFSELTEERQREETDPDNALRAVRHAAVAQVGVPVGVQVKQARAVTGGSGFAVAERELGGTGLIDAVSRMTVPPFEAPIGIPAYIGGQEGLHGNVEGGGIPFTVAKGTPVPAEVRDPRMVERVLAETISRAGERGVGARQSTGTEERLLATQERQRVASTNIQRTPWFATPSPMAEALRLELWAAAAMAYGVWESVKAIRNVRLSKPPRGDTGKIYTPRPILRGRPRTTGLGSGSGDVPGIMQEFRTGLRQGEQP